MKTYKYLLLSLTTSLVTFTQAATLVKWGASGGDLGITSSNADAGSVPNTYTFGATETQTGTAWYESYNAATDTPTFNAASSIAINLEVRSAVDGDYFTTPRNVVAGATYISVYTWDVGTHTLTSTSPYALNTYNIEFRRRSASAEGTVQILVRDSLGNFHVSTQSDTTIANAHQSFTGSFSDLTWNSYTPLSSGSDTIGGASTPTLTGITAVGLRVVTENLLTTTTAVDTRFRHVEFTVLPEPSSLMLLTGGLVSLACFRRRKA